MKSDDSTALLNSRDLNEALDDEESFPLISPIEEEPIDTSSRKKIPKSELVGYALMAMSAFAFASMSLAVKLASDAFKFPSSELVVARSVIQGLLALIYLLVRGLNPLGPAKRRVRLLLIQRGLSGSIGLGCFFYAITAMPLPDATVIFFTGPMFTAILARVVLKEPITRWDWLAMLSCLTGVVLVARPVFIFGSIISEPPLSVSGVIAALAGAMFSAVAYVSVRLVTKAQAGIPVMVHVFYFGVISSILSPIALFSFQETVVPHSALEYLALIAVGIFAFAGQIFVNRGLQLAPAGPATLMRNLDVALSFVFSITILHELPHWTSILGATIIVGVALFVGVMKAMTRNNNFV